MGFVVELRGSDSPYVETIMRGRTEGDGTTIRPAENHWHMVLAKFNGEARLIAVGPLAKSGEVSYTEGAEILWIKFRLGTFMPCLPAADLRDREIVLPDAGTRSFWLHGSAWQIPDFENADTFIARLVHDGTLIHDPIVPEALQDRLPEVPSRTLRHRFLRATGLNQNHIRQVERAQRAAALLQQGMSILDTVDEVGYFDQPHLTRSLKQYIGYTPAQIARIAQAR